MLWFYTICLFACDCVREAVIKQNGHGVATTRITAKKIKRKPQQINLVVYVYMKNNFHSRVKKNTWSEMHVHRSRGGGGNKKFNEDQQSSANAASR